MITINRDGLLDDLYEFASAGSGLLVGKPGVGKSYMGKALQDKFLDNNIPAEFIRIDSLVDASDQSINEELKITANWIDLLKKIKLKDGKKALLIFDAFDAARNEGFRNEILSQIKKARHELAEKWNVLVSVRTYDAAKSLELIKLFPINEDHPDFINCRKTFVPELTDNEVKLAVEPQDKVKAFYAESTAAFKEIVRIPFFLVLANDIVSRSDAAVIDELKALRSETQLLNIYWNLAITSAANHLSKEQALISLLDQLIGAKALSCSKADYLRRLQGDLVASVEYLLQENILHILSVGSERISFSHNILFDYAVSRLYLRAEPGKLLEFIKQDPTRPFFLRPSFVYFFTQLWYDDKNAYWKIYTAFSDDTQKEIQLFLRLVVTGVVASEFQNIDELSPLLKQADESKATQFIRYLLQSLRFIRKRTLTQDIVLLEDLSTNLDIQYVFDYGFLLDRAIKDETIYQTSSGSLGVSARNFLGWILAKRKTELKPYIERLGAGRGVELVCKTYSSDANTSRTLLESIFEMFNEPDYDIYYFMNLCEYVKDILEYDPKFVGEVYLTIFRHEETSTEETLMGSSVIMNFRSNRRQDFEMCYFRLVQFFPTFLNASAEIAIPVSLAVVNLAILKDRSTFISEVAEIPFDINGKKCVYIPDNASLWSDRLNYHKAAQMVPQIINHFTELSKNGKQAELNRYLNLYVLNAKCGFTWKEIVEFCTGQIDKLVEFSFHLCIAPPLLRYSETYYEIGQLMEVGIAHFSDEQVRQIEQAIHEVSKMRGNSEYPLSRFLSRIPLERLQLQESRDYIEKHGSKKNEKPVEFSSSVSDYSTEMWLEDQNVNVQEPKVRELLEVQRNLAAFNSRWLNHPPPRTEYEGIVPALVSLFKKLKPQIGTLHKDVTFTVLNEIAHTATIIAKSASTLTPEEFKDIKEIVLFAFDYESEYDKSDDEEASPSRGYSPTPRINSAEALALITAREPTPENVSKIIQALEYPNGIIRFNASRHLQDIIEGHEATFYPLLLRKIKTERDAMIASSYLTSLSQIPYDEKKANEIMEAGYSNEHLFSWNNNFIENYSFVVSWYAISKKNKAADKILLNAHEREEFARDIVFRSFEDLRVNLLRNKENNDYYIDSAIRWTLNYIDKYSEELRKIPDGDFNQENPVVKKCLSFYDFVIQRSYFALDSTVHGNRPTIPLSEKDLKKLYFKIKPVLEKIQLVSSEIQGGGLVTGHTAHYFIQLLNLALPYDTKVILNMATEITMMAAKTGYTFDSMAIQQVVNMTEKLLADYRQLIAEDQASFDNLIKLLDLYINSGWIDALELLWKLDEIFK